MADIKHETGIHVGALADARRALHAAMAAGQTEEVDRLSALCFALIRRGR